MTDARRLITRYVHRLLIFLGLLKCWNPQRRRLRRLTVASTLTALLAVTGAGVITRAPRVGITITATSAVLGGLTIIAWWTTR